MNDFAQLLSNYNNVALFRHINPDGDALASQFALYTFLKTYYPSLNIKVIGKQQDPFHYFGECEDDTHVDYSNTLAIVLDTANKERIDGNAFGADKVIKIDHHLNVDNYGDLNIVNEQAASTCQVLIELFNQMDYPLTREIARYLAFGLISDSLGFAAAYTSVATIDCYKQCLLTGIDHVEVFRAVKTVGKRQYQGKSLIRSNVVFNDKIAYTILTTDILNQHGLNWEEVKDFVNELSGVEGVDIWALFTQIDDGSYKVSLRSYMCNINQVAIKHNGGGHLQASGCKAINSEEIQCIIDELIQVANTK